MLEMSLKEEERMKLFIDNKYVIDLTKHSVAHGRSNIETPFHFLRDQVNNDKLQIKHCKTEEEIAYFLTKALKTNSLEYLRNKLGMV